MKIVDDTNWKAEIGDGKQVISGGETRLLSALPKPAGHDSRAYSRPFSLATIPRGEWSDRIKELDAKKMQIRDFQNWPCDNQGSFPTCWAAGTCQAVSTCRVMQMGLEHYVRFSAMAIAVPISGGHSGGYEGEAVKYFREHGGVDSKLWSYTDPSRKNNDPAVVANRLLHKVTEAEELNGFEQFMTAMLLGFPCTVSYNWWSHVVSLAGACEIEKGSFGLIIRNNWGDSYGDKYRFGHGGYAVFREGRGTPSGGLRIQVQTPSLATAA